MAGIHDDWAGMSDVLARAAVITIRRHRLIGINKIECKYFGARYLPNGENWHAYRHECKVCHTDCVNACAEMSHERVDICGRIQRISGVSCPVGRAFFPHVCVMLCKLASESEKPSATDRFQSYPVTMPFHDNTEIEVKFTNKSAHGERVANRVPDKKKRSMFNFGGKK